MLLYFIMKHWCLSTKSFIQIWDPKKNWRSHSPKNGFYTADLEKEILVHKKHTHEEKEGIFGIGRRDDGRTDSKSRVYHREMGVWFSLHLPRFFCSPASPSSFGLWVHWVFCCCTSVSRGDKGGTPSLLFSLQLGLTMVKEHSIWQYIVFLAFSTW